MTKSHLKHIVVFLLVCFIAFPVIAQNEESSKDVDQKESKKKKEKKPKKEKKTTGWVPTGFPFATFDSDLGLQLGVLGKLLDYGDGSRFPMYNHSLYLEASWYLKGSGIFRFYYDSDRLIKGIRTSFDVSYIPDRLFKFFGFNGYEAVYNRAWEDDSNPAYKSRAFYRYNRKFFRTKLDFQGNIIGDNFRWLAGADFYSFTISPVDIDHLNQGKSEDKQLPDTIGLYEQYTDWNIINEYDAEGGMLTAFKLGLIYDSRDNEHHPTRGLWSEIILVSAPKFTSNMERGFSKIAITHRQYINLVKNHLTFAYRLGFQSTISGITPYYAQGLMFYSFMTGAYSEGLGGGGTIRGVQRNRIIGDGFIFGNFELRWKIAEFYLWGGNRFIGLSGFFDTGRVITFMDIESSVNHINDGLDPEDPGYVQLSDYFNFGGEKFHNAFGAGLYLSVNPNFIVSIDYGQTLNEQDGETGFYIGLNYLF